MLSRRWNRYCSRGDCQEEEEAASKSRKVSILNHDPSIASEDWRKQQTVMRGKKEKGGRGGKQPFAMDVPLMNNPFREDDDLVTWVHIEDPLDRSYCSELFGELPRAHHVTKDSFLNDQAAVTAAVKRERDGSQATAEAFMAMGARRAADVLPQAGADASNRVSTSVLHPHATTCSSELAIPSPLRTTPPQQHHLRSSLSISPSHVDPPKISSHVPSTNIDGSIQPVASPSKVAFNFCRLSKATSSTGIVSSREPDLSPHGTEQSRQETGCSSPPTFLLEQDVDATKKKVAGVHRDTSASSITASEKGIASLQTTEVSSSWGSDTNTEKSVKDASGSVYGKKIRSAEGSDHRSEDVEEAAANAKKSRSARSRATKRARARAAETHNFSERKRRDKINSRMKALQELIPNANKTDKASVLDEAIEYLKMLQAQLQLMSMRTGMIIPPTMTPLGMQYLPMQHGLAFPHMGMRMGMGMKRDDDGPPDVLLPSLYGQSLSGTAIYASEFQPNCSSSVIDEAQKDLQNFHLNQPYNTFPAQQQQPVHLGIRKSADMISTFIKLQQQRQENGDSEGIR